MCLMTGFPDGGTIWRLWDHYSLLEGNRLLDICLECYIFPCFFSVFLPSTFWSPCHREIPQQTILAIEIFCPRAQY